MPEMTGVELLGQVKNRYPDAVRIVFTGYADIKAVVEGINNGGLFRYITKPWDPDELILLLHQAAARHDALVERRQLLVDLRDHLASSRRAGHNRPPDLSAGEVILHDRLDRFLREQADAQ
jgi:DNA-binding NtrC family response regulator